MRPPTITPSHSLVSSSHALVVLTILDVDDERPRFVSPRYSFALPENVAIGSFTGVVVAVDRDSSPFADFRYELNSSMFAIDAHSGVIVTRAPLDRETAATHRLAVSVHTVHPAGTGTGNGPNVDRSDEASVVVRVDDVNDNAPHFRFPLPTNHTLRVPSTSGVGTMAGHVIAADLPTTSGVGFAVGHVVARDPDAGDNARLTYHLVEPKPNNHFRLTADSGELTVVGNLSALVASGAPRRLRLVVRVSDGGRPSRSATGVLTVHVVTVSAPGGANASSVGLSASHQGM